MEQRPTLNVPVACRVATQVARAFAGVRGSPRLCQVGWFVAWLASLAATSAHSGAVLGAHGFIVSWPQLPASLHHATWLLHLVATTELLLALSRDESSARKLRRAIRLAPLGGLASAALAIVILSAFDATAARAQELPFFETACLGELVLVAVAGVALNSGAAPTRLAQLRVYLVGWGAHAAGLLRVVLPASTVYESWLSPADGTLVFVVLAGGLLVHALHAEAQRRLRAQRELVDSARRYRHVYYSAPVALMSVDPCGAVLRWNDLAAQLFCRELRMGRVNSLGAVIGRARAAELLARVAQSGRYRSELQLRIDDDAGESAGAGERTCEIDALLAADEIEISVVDVTERSLLARTLEHMAYHDPLTDGMNLRGLERELERVSHSVSQGGNAALLYMDLMRFKSINDLYGYSAGNSIVVEVSKRLRERLPESAGIGRLGGDEFLVVLPECAPDRARELAREALACIVEEPFDVEGKRIRVEASLGVVDAAPDMGASELIAYACAACEEARKQGKGGIASSETSLERLARYRSEVELGARLRSSLPIERMSVFAQPIVPLRDGPAKGSMCYEVLLRERDEEGRIQSPARLIAAAERHGAMRTIDRFMLERTLQHLGENPAHAASLDFVTVNLSGISLNDDRFLADAYSLLREHGPVARKVCLEITESIAMYDLDNTRGFVERMRSLGVRIALDDFGAGHSSFAYLRELPASLIKIDGQFMLAIDRSPRNQVIVSGIRRLTEELGVACLAEWIEDIAALEFLLGLEMDYAQGYVLARPQPIESWLTQDIDLGPLEEARRRVARALPERMGRGAHASVARVDESDARSMAVPS